MTWKEFKIWIEEKGVREEDEIIWMDFSTPNEVDIKEDKDGNRDITVW